MTVDEAVKVLNERRHHGHSGWYVCPAPTPDDSLVLGESQYDFFEPFEAVAIAEKYVSETRSSARA